MKSREFHWNRPFPAVRVRPGYELACELIFVHVLIETIDRV